MYTFDAVSTLLAVRAYQERPIPDAILRKVVEAGRLSPSAMNRQPWHFVVVRDSAMLRRLGAIATSAPYIAGAPAAIVVAIEPGNTAISDVSRAIQSMLLTAWSEGIGSNWGGFLGLDAVNPLLDIPATMDIVGILPLGYPAGAITGRKKRRKPLAEVASSERFGQAFG